MIEEPQLRLLLFNLATDADAVSLGFTTWWINALAPYCEYIDVVSMRVGRLAVAPNVRVWSIGKEKGYSKPRRVIEFYRILIALLNSKRYDACFAHMMPLFAVMGWPFLKIRGIRITLWYAHKSVTLILRMAERLVDCVVTPSAESFRIKSTKVKILGHGIDTEIFNLSTETRGADEPFIIISIGRIAPVKRLEVLIEAVKILVADGINGIQLRLIGGVHPGDNAYAVRLQDLVAEYELDTIVRFAGQIPFERIASEYQHADVMVNLCTTGSVDKAVLEAMSCGLPVVTSNETFFSILDKWAGLLLVSPDDAVTSAARLKHVISMSTQDRKKLGMQLRGEVEKNHNLTKLAGTLVSCFTSAPIVKPKV